MKKVAEKKHTTSVNIKQNAYKHIRSRRKKMLILQIIPEFRNVFVNKLTIAFKRNKNMQNLISDHLIKYGKVAKKKLEKR